MRFFDFFYDLLVRFFDEGLSLLTFLLDALNEIVVCFGIQIAKAQVLKLPLNVRYAETVRKRRIDFDGLACNAFLLVFTNIFEGAHVMQAISKLYHDDADILRHGEEHLSVTFKLLLFFGFVLYPAELRHAINEHGDLVTKKLAHFLQRMRCLPQRRAR